MYPPVVLQVPRRGELLAAVLLSADEGLLAVVDPHVNLQPLQHVEALAAALGAAPEHPVVPAERRDVCEPFTAVAAQTTLNFAAEMRKTRIGVFCSLPFQTSGRCKKHLFQWEVVNRVLNMLFLHHSVLFFFCFIIK